MKKILGPKTLVFLNFMLLSLNPVHLFAQAPETVFSADKIIIEQDHIIQAVGNVKIENGDIFIHAESLKINKKTNEFDIGKIYKFFDGDSTELQSESAEFDERLAVGVISAAKILIDETVEIWADTVTFESGTIASAKNINRVTSCRECEGKELVWYLTASSADRDVKNSNIVYRNVTVRVKGFPVAYIPYLRMPDPSVDRAIGFLVPEAVFTSNLATGLKLPYFIPIGLSSDILLTPYFSSKTKTLEYRYRRKFNSGNLTVNGALSKDDFMDNDLRYFSQLIGDFKLGYGVDLNFNAGKVSDTSYLGDYVYSEQSDFNSEISLGKVIVDRQQFFDGDLSYLRKKEQGNSLNEYYSLSGSYIREVSSLNLPGKFRLSASLNSSLNVNDEKNFSRPPSSARFGIDYKLEDIVGPMLFSFELFGDLNSFVNSADTGTNNEEFTSQYGVLTSITAPSFLEAKGKHGFLKPKISLSFNDQGNDILGSYFIGVDELSWGNIHSGKKIMSLTESEIGLSVSIGLDGYVFWETGQQLGISVAASKIDDLTYIPMVSSGLVSGNLNYLGKLSFETKNKNKFSTSALFSEKGRMLKGDIRGKYAYKKIDLNGKYEFLDQSRDSRLSQKLETIDLFSSYALFEDLKVSAGGLYDLTQSKTGTTSLGLGFSTGAWKYQFSQEYLKEKPEKFSLSAIYDDDCTRLTFSFENRYQDLGSSQPIKSLMLRVQLKPFANVTFSQGGDQITF